jgi:predicted nucleotidyltransferase
LEGRKGRKRQTTMELIEILHKNRSEILRIAARHGARKVRVFGSVARSEATADSDIDFLVEMEPGRSLFDLGGLHADLEELLGCKVDVVTDGGISPYLKDRILSEARPL